MVNLLSKYTLIDTTTGKPVKGWFVGSDGIVYIDLDPHGARMDGRAIVHPAKRGRYYFEVKGSERIIQANG